MNKAEIIRSFLLQEINLTNDLVLPKIQVDLNAHPLQIDLTELFNSPQSMNFLAYFLCYQKNLFGNFDAILTHLEAAPLAIGFSQALQIPWFSVTFRTPSSDPSQITQYPYLIDQEHVSTVFFSQRDFYRKKILVISDYIRKGGLLDVLFRIVDDNKGMVSYLVAIIGIGPIWKRFNTELDGQLTVYHLL